MNELYLAHHGVKGQKWGVRRYQNPDGSLTTEGKARYGEMEKDSQYLSKSMAIMTQSNVNYTKKAIKNKQKELAINDKTSIQRDVSESLYKNKLKELSKKYGSSNIITGFINDNNNDRITEILSGYNKINIEKGKQYTYALIMDEKSGLNNVTITEIRDYINK